MVGLAARYEDYSDFGSDDGKALVVPAPASVRSVQATASTGFRAPSLQQQYSPR
jgi:iron complex outermembrane receptor protein